MSERRLERVMTADGPFDALLEAVDRDPDAARGLALAYAEMERSAREALVEAIIEDGAAAGRSPAGPLALLLAVEDDAALARAIARGLDETLTRRGVDAGFVWGDDREGGVAVVRHLHGGFVEVLRVAWGSRGLDVDAEPLAVWDEGLRRRYAIPEESDRVPLERAIDRLAHALWRARQGGRPLPERLRAFAHLFSTDAEVSLHPGDDASG